MPKLKPAVVIDPSTYRRYKVVYLPDGKVEFVELIPPRAARAVGNGGGKADGLLSAEPPTEAIPEIDPAFKARLSSVLTDNKYDRQLARRKSGKLSMQGLWRVSTGANNVFSQKQARGGKHYNVVLVVDQSGSMFSSSYSSDNTKTIDFAANAALYLGKHFQAIDIDYSVIGFADRAKVLKPLDQEAKDWAELRASMLNPDHDTIGGGTDIAAGLEQALQELKHAEGKSLVIVLTDGDTDRAEVVKKIVNANSQRIEFLGVGLNSGCKAIADNKRIDDMQELQPLILGWLQRKIRRGV